ncbi:MAG TPA: condensation domain-containing protein [Polyangia bacterium]|nr:condensation domain-containing protein [Polyangia bacterium]
MRTPSLRRYLVVQLALPALIVNALFNGLLGWLFHPARHAISRGTIVVDTLVDAAFVAFFTMFIVGFTARREARAGRQRGWGRAAPWLTLPARRPLTSAAGLALASVVVLGVPAVAALTVLGVAELSRDSFVWFKALFAGVTAVVSGIAVALTALAAEPEVALADPRWWRDDGKPPTGVVYPFDHLDKGGLVVTHRERGSSATVTWRLVFTGALDAADVRTALTDVVTRYPSMTTKVQSLDGTPEGATRFRYAHDPSFTLDAIFTVADLRDDPAALEPLLQEHRDRHLDLFTDFPVTLTLVHTADARGELIFRQHHGIADGRAFYALMVDFCSFLEAARTRRRPSAEALAPIGRRSDLEAFGLGAARRFAWTLAGHVGLAREVLSLARRPPTPLLQNRSNDYSGANGTIHWALDDSVLVSWNAVRKRIGCSLNSLLTAALFVANERVGRARHEPVGRTIGQLMMETRPRDGRFLSFANHLAPLKVEIDLARESDLATVARDIQTQVDAMRDNHWPIKRYLAERVFVSLMTLDELRPLVFDTKAAPVQIDFSNLIALELPAMGGDGWSVDAVLATTPVAPRTGIIVTVIRYRGRLCFNFNFKASAVSRADTDALLVEFQSLLAAL